MILVGKCRTGNLRVVKMSPMKLKLSLWFCQDCPSLCYCKLLPALCVAHVHRGVSVEDKATPPARCVEVEGDTPLLRLAAAENRAIQSDLDICDLL